MIKRINYALLISIFYFASLHAQSNDYFYTPKTFPAAPSAYEFMKYGDIPVSKYTGVPNISIPIYTVSAGPNDLQIPISLNYHSNGFKVNEEAGWTGLGWTLNAGGWIVQKVNNYDDFKVLYPNRELPDLDKIIHHVSNGHSPLNYWSSDGCTAGQTYTAVDTNHFGHLGALTDCISSNYDILPIIPRGLFGASDSYDYEPDIFSFSFLNHSGKFVLDWSTETFKSLSDPRYKIEKNGEGHDQIKITTPDGNVFLFEIREETPLCDNVYDCNSFDGQNGNESFLGVTSRVYKLKRIHTSKGNTVYFNYDSTGLLDNLENVYSSLTTVMESDVFSKGTGLFGALVNRRGHHKKNIRSVESFSYLSSISFNGGSVLFHDSDRLDFVGTRKLDEIRILKGGRTYNSFSFAYSYFEGHTSGNVDEDMNSPKVNKSIVELTHRLKLDSVTERGKPSYTFEYDETALPKKNSYAKDYWGYYNGALTNKNHFPNVYRFNYDDLPEGRNWHMRDKTIDFFTGNNRSSRLEYCKASVLKKVNYPTGGSTEYDYELNSFTNAIVPNFEDTESTIYSPDRVSYGAGLRIKEIKSFDSANNLSSHKLYSYKDGKLTAPVLFINKTYIPNYTDNFYSRYYPVPITNSGSGFVIKAVGHNMIQPPSINANGNLIGYSEVTEHFVSADSSEIEEFSVVSVFENHDSDGVIIDTNKALITDSTWMGSGHMADLGLPLFSDNKPENGILLEERIYDENEILQQKTLNTYSYQRVSPCTYGVRAGAFYKRTSTGYRNLCSNFTYMLGGYAIGSLYTYLDNTERFSYFENDSVSVRTDFIYNGYLQLIDKRTVLSNGDLLQESKQYTSSLPVYKTHNFLSGLKSKTILRNNRVVDQITYDYEQIDVPNHYPNANSGKLHFINRVEDVLKNKLFDLVNDEKGNLVYAIDNNGGAITYYVWGYAKTKIIARIENYESGTSQNNAIVAAQSASNYDNYISNQRSEQEIRLKLHELQQAFPNSLVTTYTYDPYTGIKSMTDPKGQTTTYHYDTFNRLKHIKDHQGHIVESYDYHYQNE